MNDQNSTLNEPDDTEAHRIPGRIGHADAESTEGDNDVEGHKSKGHADAESAEGDDDVEGHALRPGGRG